MTNNPESNFESAIYEGTVRHRRFSPRSHNFDYPLFMFLLKVDEIPRVVRAFWQLSFRAFSWARFKRDDYIISDHEDIAEAVRAKLSEELKCPNGRAWKRSVPPSSSKVLWSLFQPVERLLC